MTLTPAVWAWLLRDRRERAGITSCAELARRTFCHPSYVTKVESLDRPPSRDFAVACDVAIGTDGQLADAWDRVDWTAEIRHPNWFQFYADLEAESLRICGYDVQRVWGLLQTEAYARALTRHVKRGADEKAVEEAVTARLARQQRFLAPDGPPLVAIMDEAVIRQVVGGPVVMHEQLQRLLDLGERHPNIIIQVAPFALGERTGATGAFTLIELPDGARWAYSESMSRGYMQNNPTTVAQAFRAYDQLRAVALSAPDSARLIRSVMRGLNNVTTSRAPQLYPNRHAAWQTSSYSQGDGGNCIEVATNVAQVEQVVPVRDSKDRQGPELGFSPAAWSAFVAGVAAGDFGAV
ncbi:Scr1 family TA system antitoxin-like transcriptional regulator [Kitasatospora sp. NPDC058170]|uniref:Scr1 family TA system antitoxin-like transcriptional regulator n=1 Tax=Kitasatospora sp. NPDC058170 TaxID=3346364 RepID=UPI0036DE39B0